MLFQKSRGKQGAVSLETLSDLRRGAAANEGGSLRFSKKEGEAKTEYQGKTLSLVRIKLYTGRTHQIRVQFASRGMPVAGDGRYGSRLKCDNISLCSVKIAFIHPSTGEKTVFASQIPESGYAPESAIRQTVTVRYRSENIS